MTDRASSLAETLASLRADRDARRFDGAKFEDAVLRHAAGIPSWEVAECWRYREWPERTTVGVPLPSHDAGIDLVAVKHDGSRVAIQCKARSGGGAVTTTQVQKFAGAAPSSVFAERWMVAEAGRSAATEDAAAVAGVTFVDFEAALADARDSALERERDEVGSVCEWPEDHVRAGDWSPVQWFDPELAQAVRSVRDSSGLVPLREVFEIGPPGRSVRDEFERVPDDSAESGAIPVFDSVSGPLRSALAGDPDEFWRVRPDSRRRRPAKPGLVESHLRRAGWVLLALRSRTNNAAVVALSHREKSLGNGFVPIVTDTVRQAKSLCVLWNSTPALLQLLNLRTRMLMYPNWSIAQLGTVKVPQSLRTVAVESDLAGVFDRLRHEPLQPWMGAETDPVRREIDDAVAEVYGHSPGVLTDWRERLAREPTIANRSPF